VSRGANIIPFGLLPDLAAVRTWQTQLPHLPYLPQERHRPRTRELHVAEPDTSTRLSSAPASPGCPLLALHGACDSEICKDSSLRHGAG